MTDWRSWPISCVIDPHPRKPFYMAWFRITPHNEHVAFREWPDFDFFAHKSWDWGLDEYIAEIRRIESSFCYRDEQGIQREPWIPYRILDPNMGRTPNIKTGRRLDEEFAEAGLYFDTTVDDSIDAGVLSVNRALKDGRLKVLRNCPNMIKAFQLCTWDDWGQRGEERAPKETLKDKYKDPVDVARYEIMFDGQFVQPSELRSRFSLASYANGGLGMSRWR